MLEGPEMGLWTFRKSVVVASYWQQKISQPFSLEGGGRHARYHNHRNQRLCKIFRICVNFSTFNISTYVVMSYFFCPYFADFFMYQFLEMQDNILFQVFFVEILVNLQGFVMILSKC